MIVGKRIDGQISVGERIALQEIGYGLAREFAIQGSDGAKNNGHKVEFPELLGGVCLSLCLAALSFELSRAFDELEDLDFLTHTILIYFDFIRTEVGHELMVLVANHNIEQYFFRPSANGCDLIARSWFGLSNNRGDGKNRKRSERDPCAHVGWLPKPTNGKPWRTQTWDQWLMGL